MININKNSINKTDNRTLVRIAFDDTDSRDGMCTTYIAHLLVEHFLKEDVIFQDYPQLIRLNPNIPWKTRGNGAVLLKFLTENTNKIFEQTCNIVSKYSEIKNLADPGVVMSTMSQIPTDISNFYEKALAELVSRKEAVSLIKKHNMMYKGWGRQRGIIGALAAIGSNLEDDATFELIAFRSEQNFGHERLVDKTSIINMSNQTYPLTFNNYDKEKNRVLITPRGADPVLIGLRGEYPDTVFQAYQMLKIYEKVNGYMIFKSNQGTGAHIKSELDINNLKAYRSGQFKCEILHHPKVGIGGHVYIKVKNEKGCVDCAAYEPTGGFRKIVLSLIPGDKVEIAGSVRKRTSKHKTIINLEYIRIIELAENVSLNNPECNICGKRMKSKGHNQGFHCNSCNITNKKVKKIIVKKPRLIQIGLYLPPPRSQRHLTKPHQRYLIQKKIKPSFIDQWFSPPYNEIDIKV